MKNEAKSMLAPGHPHADRVVKLLQAAQQAIGASGGDTLFGAHPIGLELTVESPNEPPADATNFLGGVGDVLEVKGHRGALAHLGSLVDVGLYSNDRQIHEVQYRIRKSSVVAYVVRIWELTD